MRIAIALCLFTATAQAGEHELSIGSSSRTLRSNSANAVTADSLGGGALAYAHHLDVAPLPALALWLEGSWGWGGAEGTMFQTLFTELDTHHFAAAARASYEIHPRVVGSARLGLGLQRAALAIRDNDGHTAADKGWGGTTSGTLALDLLAINHPRFAFGLRVEMGYVLASAISLTATPESESDGTLQLEMTAAGLGELDLSGATLGASMIGRF